jgi:hypothetical protein
VRESVDGARAHASAAAEADGRRLPPLYDPEFLDAIKTIPPPRLAPAFLRRKLARNAVAALLPFLDESLSRYGVRLRAWGEGALKELRPGGEAAAVAGGVRSPELSGLEQLINQIGAGHDSQPSGREETMPC